MIPLTKVHVKKNLKGGVRVEEMTNENLEAADHVTNN